MSKNKVLHDATAVRAQVLRGLSGNRALGFHFPGYFLDIAWPSIGADTVVETMPDGPHCRNARGEIDPTALGVMIDTALATAPRLTIAVGARQATVHLAAQFTGAPARGRLSMSATLEGFSRGGGIRQAHTRGVLRAGGRPLCYASGTFVVLPPPPGVRLAPLPWQRTPAPRPAPLAPEALDAHERRVLRACDAALARADARHGFIERFWGALPRPTRGGARLRVPIGPQIGNRVGHVQGGILWGLAAATAGAAAPRHPRLSAISVWYVSPGQGSALTVESRVLHAGRSFAVVRTGIRNADGGRVLEALSNHAA